MNDYRYRIVNTNTDEVIADNISRFLYAIVFLNALYREGNFKDGVFVIERIL